MLARRLLSSRGVITTDLMPGDSVDVNNGPSGGWAFGASDPANTIDGSESTYAQFTGTSGSTTSGTLTITFPVIEASEILEVRWRCKGKGPSSGLFHTHYWTSAADLTAKPSRTHSSSFIAGSSSTPTMDSGLVSTDYAESPSGGSMDFDASTLVGTSSGVLDYWAGGVRLGIGMSDFNLGGTGGLNYGPLIQVKYRQ